MQYLPKTQQEPDKKAKHSNENLLRISGTCIKPKKQHI